MDVLWFPLLSYLSQNVVFERELSYLRRSFITTDRAIAGSSLQTIILVWNKSPISHASLPAAPSLIIGIVHIFRIDIYIPSEDPGAASSARPHGCSIVCLPGTSAQISYKFWYCSNGEQYSTKHLNMDVRRSSTSSPKTMDLWIQRDEIFINAGYATKFS